MGMNRMMGDAHALPGLFPPATGGAGVFETHKYGLKIIGGAVAFYVSAVILSFVALAESNEQLLPLERTFAQGAGTILLGSVIMRLMQLFFSPHASPTKMADAAMLATNMIAASANLMMGTMATPILVDPLTGTTEYMIRWCEWTTLAFLMTCVVEAVAAKHSWESLSLGLLMGLSAGCGLVFPFCTSPWTWGLWMFFSFITYFALFPRYFRRKRLYEEAVRTCACPSDVMNVVENKVSHNLMTCCTIMWTLITLDYCVTWFAALWLGDDYKSGPERPQWPFILDCVLDVTAKLLYAHIISCSHAHVPLEADRQQARWIREAMDTVWAGSQDTIVLSERRNDSTVRTIASNGLGAVLGKEETSAWAAWRTLPIRQAAPTSDLRSKPLSAHEADSSMDEDTSSSDSRRSSGSDGADAVAEPALQPDRSASVAFQQLIEDAWHWSERSLQKTFTTTWVVDAARPPAADGADEIAASDVSTMLAGAGAGAEPSASASPKAEVRRFEVQVTKARRSLHGAPSHVGTTFLILVLRDVTERERMQELERQLVAEIADKSVLAERIGRKKDEEANRFTRHEVKNCVLAAIAQCEALVDWHAKTTEGFAQAVDTQPLREGLTDLSSKLQRTLNTVLAAAMAKDLANGDYVAKPEFTTVETLLRDNLASNQRFEMRSKPSPLPPIWLDPQLLFCVHRNAISNAVKYGCQTSKIETQLTVEGAKLTLRVTNAPGDSHAELLKLQNAECVFERGLRLHNDEDEPRDAQLRRVSAGDGGWIMRQCARALGGDCSIRFEESRTVFELHCPATTRQETSQHEVELFQLPPSTVCVGIDDSKVQRKILGMIFSAVGGQPERTVILGDEDKHILHLAPKLAAIVRESPNERVFVIGDENLDLTEGCASTTVSCTQAFGALHSLLSEDEMERVLLVIRSANDSRTDIGRYLEHAHAVLPKRGFAKQATIDTVAPMWRTRFPRISPALRHRLSAGMARQTNMGSQSKMLDEIRCEVSRVVCKLCQEISARSTPWENVKRALVTIKGELASLNAVCGGGEEQIVEVVRRVEALLAHEDLPHVFQTSWPNLLMAINRTLASAC